MNPNRRQVTELALLIASVLAYPNAAAAGDPCVEATAKLNAFDRSYDSQMDDLRQRSRDDQGAINQAQQQQLLNTSARTPTYLGKIGVPNSELDEAETDLEHINSARAQLDQARRKLERERDNACAVTR